MTRLVTPPTAQTLIPADAPIPALADTPESRELVAALVEGETTALQQRDGAA